MAVLDPAAVLAALQATGRVYVCLVLDVEAPAEDGMAEVSDPPCVVITNVMHAHHQSLLMRKGADWVDRQEELHRGKTKVSN